MADGTIIYRPNSDISLNHNVSSGSSGYLMINESSSDGDSSYIYQSISSTSTSTKSSNFGFSGNVPSEKYEITSATLHSYARRGSTNDTADISYNITIGGSSKTLSGSSLKTSYADTGGSIDDIVSAINNEINSSGGFPDVSVTVNTSGKLSSKNNSNYIRVTQVYLEFQYNLVSTTSSIFIKEEGIWNKYSKVYQKRNGTWTEVNIKNIFSGIESGSDIPYSYGGKIS